jgi:hypothetical protein
MTAPHRPDPDDLASALLDGLLDADESEAARRDPAVVARVAALAAARDALATPPPPPDAAGRERAISAALAAFDAETSVSDDDAITAADAGPSAPPRPFDHATPLARPAPAGAAGRGRRTARTERWVRWLGAAAAVVLVVAGVSLLARGDGSDDGDTAATSEEVSSGEGGAGSEAEGSSEADDAARDEAAESADQGADGQLAPGEVLDLGAAESPDALADRARSTLAAERGIADVPVTEPEVGAAPDTTDPVPGDEGQGGAAPEQMSEPLACPTGEATANARGGSVGLRARARLDGQPVEVWVIDVGGSRTVLAVDADCAVILDRPLPG